MPPTTMGRLGCTRWGVQLPRATSPAFSQDMSAQKKPEKRVQSHTARGASAEAGT